MSEFPGSITLSQTIAFMVAWHAFLLTPGFWGPGCFLLQALDWIQETGEFYLSTHTSTGETPEETQELLKEYGEFRGPAKVGSTLGLHQIDPALPSLANFMWWKGEQPLAQNASSQWQGGEALVGLCPLKPEYPKNGGCWIERLYAEVSCCSRGFQVPPLHAPDSGLCCVLSGHIRQRDVFV